MPFYDYQCLLCNHTEEIFEKIDSSGLFNECPKCAVLRPATVKVNLETGELKTTYEKPLEGDHTYMKRLISKPYVKMTGYAPTDARYTRGRGAR